jgi:hypothetical protein
MIGGEPSAYGKINLTFEPVINNATVFGIDVLDEFNQGIRAQRPPRPAASPSGRPGH